MIPSIVISLFIVVITAVPGEFDNPRLESEVLYEDIGATVDTVHSRPRRYLIYGPKFAWKTITYLIKTYTKHISKEMVDIIIKMAFDQWAAVTDLTFVQIESGPRNIEIEFLTSSNHPLFDGRGYVLGDVHHNTFNGFYVDLRLHFDEDEIWLSGSSRLLASSGNLLFDVALHEIGHVLGLDHSDILGAVMYHRVDKGDIYRAGFGAEVTIEVLHVDDINGILQLYPMNWTTADIRTAWQCEHTTFHLQCPNVNQTLHIVSEEFGNKLRWLDENGLNCPGNKGGATCVYPTDFMKDRCNKKNSCDVYIVVHDLVDKRVSDPCPGIVKTLKVRYVCVK